MIDEAELLRAFIGLWSTISLLENGQKFASIINAQAGSGIATSAGAKVTSVAVSSPAQAAVKYDITLNGTLVGTMLFQARADGSFAEVPGG